ncbi:glycosyltransferase family 2 protein [Staphylococcus sp. EZ-P03]|uniref:glycosyltransferase family 2 protein n=1 Tax=Staphylococcus sp. EZ-P03 TaxID=2282739 RepID=UPI000DF7A624|nr:glycosyltransferase family 2 protein [Staphylococcus sp. EZ-P03]
MNTNHKTVSVVIPYFKSSETIERAVNSVLEQTVQPKEIIIVNDFSNTPEDDNKLAELSKIELVKVVSLKENVGCGNARNNALSIASGDYIAFLDSDDSWTKEKLEVQLKVMETTDAYFSAHQSAQFEGYVPSDETHFSIKRLHLIPILLKNIIPVRSVMMKNDGQYAFKHRMRYVEDLMLWGEILGDHQKGVFINKVMCFSYKEDFGESGLTANLRKMHEGVLFVFRSLYRDKKINRPTFLLVTGFENLKYQIRKVRVWQRRRFKK